MRNILPKDLKIKFVEKLSELEQFSYESGNPFLIKIKDAPYFIFLKNLSSAYFKHSADVTRVQLPSSSHYAKIAESDIPFVILGYDIDNDVMVLWNPQKVRDRLNVKDNVSLYSRASLQNDVQSGFNEGYLSNGERIILFKRDHLIHLFENLETLFLVRKKETNSEPVSIPNTQHIADKLTRISDEDLLMEIKPLLKKNKVLKAVEKCMKHYGNRYINMTFKDWYKLVGDMYQNQ